MRTHTTRTLLALVAVAALGPACWGHEEGAPAGASSSAGSHTNTVHDGRYEVCSVGEAYGGDSHLSLGDLIDIKVNRDAPVSSVRFTVFNPARSEESQKAMTRPQSASKSEIVPMLTCCGGERLGGTMTFLHKEQRAPHFVYIENTDPKQTPKECTRKPVLTIVFCYATRDDKGMGGWECHGQRNPHGGDVHAQPQ